MSNYNPIHIPGQGERIRARLEELRHAKQPADPAPGVAFRTAVDAEREPYFIDGTANRPPDATLKPEEAIMEALEAKARRNWRREEALMAELEETQRDYRRATYLAALLFCALCWREGWWIAKWAWRLIQ